MGGREAGERSGSSFVGSLGAETTESLPGRDRWRPDKSQPREQPTGTNSALRPHYSCRRAWAAGPRRPCAVCRRTGASPARGVGEPDVLTQ